MFEQFINIFNECYPFERYILENPQSIGNLFDDAILIEIFIPNTEIKPILNSDGSFQRWTSIDRDDIYVKIKGPAGEMRMCYFDFAKHIQENIYYNVIDDFGGKEWQDLYVECDDNSKLKNKLLKQKELIEKKYNICTIKEDCINSKLIL